MASPSASQSGRHGSGNNTHRQRVMPVSSCSSRLVMHTLGNFAQDNRASGAGGPGSEARVSDSSAQAQGPEPLQSSPDMETRPHDSPLIFSFSESPPSRSSFQNFDHPSMGLENGHSQFDPRYLPEAMSAQPMGAPSHDRSDMGQSSGGTNSPLAHIHNMHPTRNTYYTHPGASGSRDGFDEDLQMLLTSASDTPPFHLAHSFEPGGSPSVDTNALHSDSETHAVAQHGDLNAQKTGYRREIEAKSRNKIRLAAQRLRNVISPGMRPGVSLRGAADVMEEAAEQIKRLSDKMIEMEKQIRALHQQLEARAHGYDARIMH